MTRNTKIAAGCGGAGCLGIILVVVVVGVLIGTGYIKAPGITSYVENSNSNSNRNSNYNYNRNSNTNSNTNTSSSPMGSDAAHKLFQAGAATRDGELNKRIWGKIGLVKADGSPNDDYGPFVREHIGWLFKNTGFVQSINTPEKARAYVDEHIDD